MNILKNAVAVLCAALLLLGSGVFPYHDVDFSIPIIANAEVKELNIANDNIVINDSGEYRITGTSTTNTITINKGCSPTITISNLNMTFQSRTSPIKISNGAKCTLIIEGENVLKGGFTKSGLNVPQGATLVIDKSSTGTLTVEGGYLAAAIGGGSNETCGTIIINAGTITATGGAGTPAIGNGGVSSSGGLIVIRDGNITAKNASGSENIGDLVGPESCVKLVGGTINGVEQEPTPETYTVTIPTGAELGKSSEISISDVTGIEDNYDKICVKLSQDIAEGEIFYLNSEESNTFDYNIKVNGKSVSNESNIIETSGNTTVSLEFSEPLSKPKYPGEYSGTLTFTISVEWQ